MTAAPDWRHTPRTALRPDWAGRPIFRLTGADGHTAIGLDTTPDADPATPEGHKIADFVRIADYLRTHGLSAPCVYEHDAAQGWLVTEDFGTQCWGDILPHDSEDFYAQALAVLLRLRGLLPAPIALPNLTDHYITRRTVWFLSDALGCHDAGLHSAFMDVWREIWAQHAAPAPCFVHGDFHPGNMMRLRDGQIGLLDFAAASWGDGVYDLVNVLEDIRRDVPDAIKTKLRHAYDADPDRYTLWHAQFYMRIMGQMVRRGMTVPPRVPLALRALMEHPVLSDLRPLVRCAESGHTG